MNPANGMIRIRISHAIAERRLAVARQHPERQELDDVVGDGQQGAEDGEEFGHEVLLGVVVVGVGRAQDIGMSAPPSSDTRAPICT